MEYISARIKRRPKIASVRKLADAINYCYCKILRTNIVAPIFLVFSLQSIASRHTFAKRLKSRTFVHPENPTTPYHGVPVALSTPPPPVAVFTIASRRFHRRQSPCSLSPVAIPPSPISAIASRHSTVTSRRHRQSSFHRRQSPPVSVIVSSLFSSSSRPLPRQWPPGKSL